MSITGTKHLRKMFRLSLRTRASASEGYGLGAADSRLYSPRPLASTRTGGSRTLPLGQVPHRAIRSPHLLAAHQPVHRFLAGLKGRQVTLREILDVFVKYSGQLLDAHPCRALE